VSEEASSADQAGVLEERARKGDRKALSDLCVLYEPRLKAFCIRQLKDLNARDPLDSARDACQEAILRGYAKYEPGPSANFWGFLCTIARHLCIDCVKGERSQTGLDNDTPGRAAPTLSEKEQEHVRQAVNRCLEKLPADERDVFIRKELAETERSFRSIAREMGRAPHKVISLYNTARFHLKRCLQDAGVCE